MIKLDLDSEVINTFLVHATWDFLTQKRVMVEWYFCYLGKVMYYFPSWDSIGGGWGCAQKPASLTVDFSVKTKGCSPSACYNLGNISSEILSRLILVIVPEVLE